MNNNRLPGYENLTDDEIDLADHYAETGNTAGLRQMLEKSAKRRGGRPDPLQMLNPIWLERE